MIINELENHIEHLDNKLQARFNEEDNQGLMESKLDLDIWLNRENTRLSHLAKKRWLKDGDNNSKFFHAYLNAKNQKWINVMNLADGTSLSTPFDIHQAAVDFFKNISGQNNTRSLPNLDDLISPVISDADNFNLCISPSLEDIKIALFSIPIDSSPGPDGFGSSFFRACWDLVHGDQV
ncbi:uncharacterized protein LOC122316177 [Carya illinoinensis]|uniref:uncharacterized protein LOC122316177 n=1 Tax=Carya illinoinensis TaxID=32201 RepID=UPI001C727B24|nr:uncharacterized protein LOC122316177 [Carya illinoinensis]